MTALLLLAALAATTPGDGGLRFGRFGEIAVYRPTGTPSATAVFFSGDGGWNQGVVDMARALSATGMLVLGVDTPRYLKAADAAGDACTYLAGDAEALSQYAQKALGLEQYQIPLLVGYSSGAGLVYAALAQAPDNTFLGALSMGFDPHLPAHTAPCERNGLGSVPAPSGPGRVVGPVSHLPAPWIVLHGDLDQVWPADSAQAFAARIGGAEFVRLPKVGHGFSVTGNWMPAFKDAAARLSAGAPGQRAAVAGDLARLPLVELPASGSGDYFAIVLSGDGGWASIDKQLGDELVRAGVPVVGFNSLQYFWNRRNPEEISADLERIIRHYQQAWHRDSVVLIGYSRGADVLPLMASRLPASLLDRVKLLAFLGIERKTNLEFRLGDWLGAQHSAEYPLLPEVTRLQGHPMLCVYGQRETDTLCPSLPPGLAEVVRLDGGHHFDGDYRGLARLILKHVH